MTLSRFNQQWFDLGRAARLKAQLHAYQTKTPVYLPMSSYNLTAAYWRDGWNSVSLKDIKNHCQPECAQEAAQSPINDPIQRARLAIGENKSCH
jgi:hypothetical protein